MKISYEYKSTHKMNETGKVDNRILIKIYKW